MRRWLVLCLLILPLTSVEAKEWYEGIWAVSVRECSPLREGFTSRTVIDLENSATGPILDQYENHCRISGRTPVGTSVRLGLVCYEFWEDFNKRQSPRKTTVTIRKVSSDVMLLDGKRVRRCAENS